MLFPATLPHTMGYACALYTPTSPLLSMTFTSDYHDTFAEASGSGSLEHSQHFRESFCESEEGVRLPRETADLRGSPGNFRGSPGNFRGSLGNFRGTSGLLFSSTVRGLPGKSPKTSGEVRETSGEVRGLSRSSGEPDSLPVTRQICLQTL